MEPRGKSTRGGFQTADYILEKQKKLGLLEQFLREEINTYYYKNFSAEPCKFISSWPASYSLKGWFVQLKKDGYQESHIHASGWLSGVVYLKTVAPLKNNEGAIELSLHGYDLPILDEAYPKKLHQPNVGDIVYFHLHFFIGRSFTTDDERCVIAFDLFLRLRIF